MAILGEYPVCHQQIGRVATCDKSFSEQIPFGKQHDFYDDPAYRHFLNCVRYVFRCQGCGVSKDGYHHHGCPNEECPECHEKLLTCTHKDMKN